jgi:hypothetical protein
MEDPKFSEVKIALGKLNGNSHTQAMAKDEKTGEWKLLYSRRPLVGIIELDGFEIERTVTLKEFVNEYL